MPFKNLFRHWTLQLFRPGELIKEKYAAFQSLLEKDKRAHDLMAELEEIYYAQTPVDFCAIEDRYARMADAVGDMIDDLHRIRPGTFTALDGLHRKIDQYVRHLMAAGTHDSGPPYVLNLTDRQALDASLVGGKAAHLAVARQSLGLPVPTGFAVTTRAFHRFLQANDLEDRIAGILARLDIRSGSSLAEASQTIGEAIRNAAVPDAVADAMHAAVAAMHDARGPDLRLAVRSSAEGEDTATSFAGQYRTLLNVDATQIADAYRQVLASKYSPAAMVYRINYGLADREVPMAVLVVEMIAAAASGVMVTRDPAAVDDDRLTIHAVWGLGQLLVDGETDAARYFADRDDPPTIASRRPHHQTVQRCIDGRGRLATRPLDATQTGWPLTDAAASRLAEWGVLLESHFGGPQDVEWCRIGDDRLVLLQTRPYFSDAADPTTERVECTFDPVDNECLLSGGEIAAAGIAAGRTVLLRDVDDLAEIPDGTVLVAHGIPPAFAAAANRLHAVVAETGSAAGHFASVAREFGIPTIVNLPNALDRLPEGIDVTVDAENGDVYRGIARSLVDSPCARRNLMADSPFMNRLGAVMSFIATLELTDPAAPNFTPHGCRSLHDIVRFVHEKAIAAMFSLSDIRLRRIGGSRKLRIGIPMLFYVIDVGGGLTEEAAGRSPLDLSDVASTPLVALFRGLTHPDIQWGEFSHFDWAAHDKAVMSGGTISPDSVMFASHAIVAARYANLNLRFGYHFVVLDAVCGDNAADNYILLRFAGGGADMDKRRLRALFLVRVFERLGFAVTRKSDLIDAAYGAAEAAEVAHALEMVGRLLGATRLMDMYLKNETMVAAYVDEFMQGRYDFSSVAL